MAEITREAEICVLFGDLFSLRVISMAMEAMSMTTATDETSITNSTSLYAIGELCAMCLAKLDRMCHPPMTAMTNRNAHPASSPGGWLAGSLMSLPLRQSDGPL